MKTEHFRKKLEEEKAKLESGMGKIGRRNPLIPDDWEPAPLEEENMESDIVDQADVIVNRENDSAILSDLEAHYDTVLAALSRIEKGTYGKCEVCGVKIEEERLEAEPAATTCIAHL